MLRGVPRPADPSRVTFEFHSDGRVVVLSTHSDGVQRATEIPEAPVGLLVQVTANPGGVGVLDADGRHAMNTGGAYFTMDVRRIF